MNPTKQIDLYDLAALLGLLLTALGAWLAAGAGCVLLIVGLLTLAGALLASRAAKARQ